MIVILISILNLHQLIVTITVPQNGMSNSNEYQIVFDISIPDSGLVGTSNYVRTSHLQQESGMVAPRIQYLTIMIAQWENSCIPLSVLFIAWVQFPVVAEYFKGFFRG